MQRPNSIKIKIKALFDVKKPEIRECLIRIDSFKNFKTDWSKAHYPEIFDIEELKEIYESLPD